MLFRQLIDLRSSTYTYLLADEDTRDAILVDPVYETAARDAALVRELGLKLRWTVETHVHADHVTGASLLRRACGSRVAIAAAAGASGADRQLSDGDALEFGRQCLRVLATPGHTDGCLSFVTEARDRVFTGDSLMIRAVGRTDFQQGDARRLYRSVHQRLFTLPDGCVVFPAHDYQGRTSTTIAEERAWNPRLGGDRDEDDFVAYMAALGLPKPAQIDRAVPANLACGRVPDESPTPGEWPGAQRSYAGVPEVSAEWLAAHLGEVLVVDVREPTPATGRIAGARAIPLSQLRAQTESLPRDKPVIAVCRAGGRSAQAALMLEKASVPRSASLAGGLARWRALGLPLDA